MTDRVQSELWNFDEPFYKINLITHFYKNKSDVNKILLKTTKVSLNYRIQKKCFRQLYMRFAPSENKSLIK